MNLEKVCGGVITGTYEGNDISISKIDQGTGIYVISVGEGKKINISRGIFKKLIGENADFETIDKMVSSEKEINLGDLTKYADEQGVENNL